MEAPPVYTSSTYRRCVGWKRPASNMSFRQYGLKPGTRKPTEKPRQVEQYIRSIPEAGSSPVYQQGVECSEVSC